MILIADSGSTKADWLLVNDKNEKIAEFSTKGINPFFHGTDFILKELNSNFELNKYADDVKSVYFYGAGVSSPEMVNKVKVGFSRYFTEAELHVGHDLDAAAYAATENGEPCIAAIMGTGSNSCYFDGDKVHEIIPALGYVLGDEGSGSYYGKLLLRNYLYNQLPPKIQQAFKDRYNLSKEEIFENVYMKDHANVYLASFSRFLSDNRDDSYIEKIIFNGMLIFMDLHVCCFPQHKDVKTHFIGSIAFYFDDILKDVAERRGIKVGKIIKKPIYHLADYHSQNILS